MGGMFDTKTDKAKRKQETALKENKERRKTRTKIIIGVTVFVLAMGAALLLNSNWIRRTVPVVTIDGIGFSVAEFEYFYNNEYSGIESQYQEQGLDFMLPDRNRPLSGQPYPMGTWDTWADFVTEGALNRMKYLTGVYNIAMANGFELPQERRDELDSVIEMYEYEVEIYGAMYGITSVDVYLQRIYGTAINEKIFRDIIEFSAIAEEYVAYMRESFEYTDEQKSGYYSENVDALDVFRYRVFTVKYDAPETEAEDYDAALEEAKDSARQIAQDYMAGIETEQDFLDTAALYDEELYGNPDYTLRELQGTNLDDAYNFYTEYSYSAWLKEAGRESGDVTTIDTAEGTAVLYFIARDDNNYNTVSMRQILVSRQSVSPDEYPDGENDPGYIEALENAQEETQARAELVDSLFTDAGRTEEALISLAEEYSDDTTEGLYEGIAKFSYQGAGYSAMQVVHELEEWLFEDGRAVGDSKLIETEAFGFHILYFTGFGEIFSGLIAEDVMRTNDIDEWLESIEYGEPVRHGWFILVTT